MHVCVEVPRKLISYEYESKEHPRRLLVESAGAAVLGGRAEDGGNWWKEVGERGELVRKIDDVHVAKVARVFGTEYHRGRIMVHLIMHRS